ncbi:MULTISPECIES: lipopolysaccharide biosynthesis protein [Sphingomonadaceae]|jgi:O-antigen/teichoic acid export membrane protein|uniref:lipopolysaccharide biosynthesis protein n=1 Tax=Sphingomonadaceae TaxID=41297 RepID=UPI0010BD03CD|nr:lipopolysaccharide biosynthesis protein [Novosphingobium sp. EMRT-2]QCI92940.1 lipopolysaccharide biosynthesis protein [Novosphingobium sp. EMRT-2]
MVEDVPGGLVRRIYGNLGKLLSGKAAAGLISLIYMIIAAHALGPTDYGVLVLVHGFVTTVGGLIEFQGWHAVVRYGAAALARHDKTALIKLLRFVGGIEIAGGIAAIAAAACLAPILGPRLGWSATALALALPYSFALLGSVRSTAAGYLQLMGRFDLLGLHNAVAPAVRLAGAILAWWMHAGLSGFLIAWLVAALLEWASLWAFALWVARQNIEEAHILGPMRGVTTDNPGIWRFMLIANADITFGELAGRISPLIIGWMLGAEAVGFYAIAQRATVVIAQPAQILGQAAYAELARLVAAGDDGRRLRRAVLHCILIAMAAAVPVILVLAFFGREVAILIGGKAFADAAPIMLWLTVARALLLAGPPASSALIAMGRPSMSVGANLIASLGLLPLLPLLLGWFGLPAAGWHAVLQAGVSSLLLLLFVFRESHEGVRITRLAG